MSDEREKMIEKARKWMRDNGYAATDTYLATVDVGRMADFALAQRAEAEAEKGEK